MWRRMPVAIPFLMQSRKNAYHLLFLEQIRKNPRGAPQRGGIPLEKFHMSIVDMIDSPHNFPAFFIALGRDM